MPDLPRILGQRPRKQSIGGSVTLRDHSRSYRRLCASLLDAEPLCRYCWAEGRISPATLIDHIVALSLGGSNDRSNLAPACADCNAAKGRVEQRFVSRGYDVADVMRDPELAGWTKKAGT
ncbi:HNH endonuclease signature motif containing protein [Sphingobium yanoikuyae]|uniref:HNH endonuclease signature motif containing protein n=1 Tax=Sphingobium yanoikuyae TaxID=13690 RepID=UPI003D767E6F